MLASVSFGEKSVGVLCGDELHRLRRQTFDVSDVLAGQNDVTGLVPHLGTGRETGSEREKINTCCWNHWIFITMNLRAGGGPAQESPFPDRCAPAGSAGSVCLSACWR